ncbi:hypothetical protein [Candidatus Synchoanobacter obligatus]|uniref:D-alanine--D-alanine ligase n=1 Tax=Candidatus Synchoanobacter obligatus TaxID=2919597 RepID=A0ABT1L6V6_9GAMM|nr:hypothetical protein [Candidatus Synchoanobacter obligatus]MCP8352546.1 hypothetical protein [Candidatus Synchoanobacter obligatus]
MSNFRLGVICGGPSGERGISLNSARSVMDHLWEIDVVLYYMNPKLEVFLLDPQQVYSNTPEDFDFKLHDTQTSMTQKQWLSQLQSLSLVLPLIHGAFGEDGTLQVLLEEHNIPFAGSGSQACKSMFYKDVAIAALRKEGYDTLQMFSAYDPRCQHLLQKHGRVVIKPQAGGSSLGVSVVSCYQDLLAAREKLLNPLCEAYCTGDEFTVLVLESLSGPVALLPTEIEIDKPGEIYDYRRKYLPTSNTRWHCPPRFSKECIQKIQSLAEEIFLKFNMKDFARLDGWVDRNGKVLFSDFNPISGMEQNSFLFLQASRVGLTHQDILYCLIGHSCQRHGIDFVRPRTKMGCRLSVPILMGGDTEERQVSLMSGTNVWLKLRRSHLYHPVPYLLDDKRQLWELPYTLALHHTTEEILGLLDNQRALQKQLMCFVPGIRQRLQLISKAVGSILPQVKPISLKDFCEQEIDYIFLALHGGFGEDGRIQQLLFEHKILFNGPKDQVSALGMDKYAFGKMVNQASIKGLSALDKQVVTSNTVIEAIKISLPWVVKPRSQGCSVGVEKITTVSEYLCYQKKMIAQQDYLVEPFIDTGSVLIKNNQVVRSGLNQWQELTIVVLEHEGAYRALYPSETISQDSILNIEEKFQGGTGVNITPPNNLDEDVIEDIKDKIERLAAYVGLNHYARIDLFYHPLTRHIYIVEMNTLPALTPSTVLYHQMLASRIALSPTDALEYLITTSMSARQPANAIE